MKKAIVTLGGAGLSPVGPGTVASLITTAAFLLMYIAFPQLSATARQWNALLIVGLLFTSALCVWLGPWAVHHFGKKDPGPVVLDEAAGICLTLLFQPLYPGWRELIPAAAAFTAFRIFDITKPWPCKLLEKSPTGWGILLDDLMAALYANVSCQLFLRLMF